MLHHVFSVVWTLASKRQFFGRISDLCLTLELGLGQEMLKLSSVFMLYGAALSCVFFFGSFWSLSHDSICIFIAVLLMPVNNLFHNTLAS